MNPKILVVTPIYEDKDYALEKYISHVEKFDYDNYDVILVDNSRTDWFFKKLQWYEEQYPFLKVFKVNRGDNSRDAICNSMNFARHYFLEHKYDYMLVVENDLFPQPDTIKRLLSYNKQVVGSYYLIGHEADDKPFYEAISRLERPVGLNPRRPCLFVRDRKSNGMMGTRGISTLEAKDWFNTGLRQVHGCGLGCTLIRDDIIMRFPYWTDNRFDNKHHDVYFYMDLDNAGIPVFVDTSINVPHQPSRWENVKDR